MNFSNDYQKSEFELDVTLREDTDNYIMDMEWNISSDFIKNLLKQEMASLVLIIKSKDNQFHVLEYSETPKLSIPKYKLCLNSRTVIQMMIKTNTMIDFQGNDDLNDFYKELKQEIQVKTGMVLGFSNTVIFDGSQRKPYDLFERKVDKSIKSDVEIRLGDETIIVVYKSEALQFSEIQNSREFNYPYLYLGLQKALISFLIHTNPDNPEEGICIDEIEPPEGALDSKLYSLMQAKNVTEINLNNIDEIIYKMSDKLMMRYADAIRGLHSGN